ncbi:hypothetical protein ON010_g14582 [Phytophthora cinnamomi]|nr:hypothetical protein ON010_g14582 [Phytophthora cinnamomi]
MKRSQPESNRQPKSKKIGRPSHGGKQCTHPGCSNKAQSRDKCRTHTKGGRCSYSGCEKQAQFKGLCAGHGGRRICAHPGCGKKVASRGKCADHGGGRPKPEGLENDAPTQSSRASYSQNVDTHALLSSASPVQQLESIADNHGDGSMMSLLMGQQLHQMTASGSMTRENSTRHARDVVAEALV